MNAKPDTLPDFEALEICICSRFRRQVMLDGEKEIAVNQYQLLFKHIKRIQLEKYYKVILYGFWLKNYFYELV